MKFKHHPPVLGTKKIVKKFLWWPFSIANETHWLKTTTIQYEYVVGVIAILLGLFVSNWAFNHINAWLGVVLYITVFGFTINYIINKFKRF